MPQIIETFILEHDIDKGETPEDSVNALESAKATGALISQVLVPITSGDLMVAGKTRAQVTRTWRSLEDREAFKNNNSASYTAYKISANVKFINLVLDGVAKTNAAGDNI